MKTLSRRALLAIGTAGALAGCASVKPQLYAISVVPGTPVGGAPRVILLREVGLARYLDRQAIVRSAADYRFQIEANNWWGENLGAMLNRVLVQELNQRLPGSTVFAEGGAVTPKPDVTLEVNISQMSEDTPGAVVLLAQAAVLRDSAPDRTRSFSLSVPVSDASTMSEVVAISTAIGQLADGLADMLRGA